MIRMTDRTVAFENKVLIIGASGFGREVLACLEDNLAGSGAKVEDVACFLDTREFREANAFVHGIPVISDEEFDPGEYHVLVAVGSPQARQRAVERLPPETKFATLIHPTAVISRYVDLGEGSIVTAGTIVTTDIAIGRHAHLNLHTTVGHDCTIGDYFTTAPGVNVSGQCTFGRGVYFGSNASVRQGITICDDVTVGMGGVVVKDITEAGVYVGNPAKKLVGK